MHQHPVARVFADEWTTLVAVLVRDLGDLTLAEDCAQEAFVEAAKRWGPDTMPERPGAWLLTTARRRAIDRVRRERRFTDRLPALQEMVDRPAPLPERLGDDQLALVFGCCHPSLDTDAQIALTLREVCGLSTGQIARAFLVAEPTMAKRLVRAKAKIRAAGVPFSIPAVERLPERLAPVLHVVYLIFTEGHTATDTVAVVRGDLCDEARWLADLLVALLPAQPEVLGLSALLCFTDSRRAARLDGQGRLLLLEDQDRALWDHSLIDAGDERLRRAIALGQPGPYQLQAAIAGTHATAPDLASTDWRGIVALYDRLLQLSPGPVVALNRAVAVAMVDGPDAGLGLLDRLADDGDLADYRYLHAARADLLRRVGRHGEARAAYDRALVLTTNEAERRFLAERLAGLDSAGAP